MSELMIRPVQGVTLLYCMLMYEMNGLSIYMHCLRLNSGNTTVHEDPITKNVSMDTSTVPFICQEDRSVFVSLFFTVQPLLMPGCYLAWMIMDWNRWCIWWPVFDEKSFKVRCIHYLLAMSLISIECFVSMEVIAAMLPNHGFVWLFGATAMSNLYVIFQFIVSDLNRANESRDEIPLKY